MKKLLLFPLLFVLVSSCHKNIDTKKSDSNYLAKVKKALSDSLSNNDFATLDFSKAIITNPDSTFSFLRIPFKGIKFSDEFVLAKTYANGKIAKGFIIDMKKDASENARYVYNGSITLWSLNRREKIESKIIKGFISAFHLGNINQRSLVVPSESNVLPEVVVTCYISTDRETYRFSDWINISNFFGGGSSQWYSSMDSGGAGGSAGSYDSYSGAGYYNEGSQYSGGSNSGGSYDQGRDVNNEMTIDDPILVDFEPVENLSPIDINKYLKCFSNIPDNGSTCSIEIFTDIPVDNQPNKFFDWSTGSPGHTFLQIKKTNGSQLVTQNIGFYPQQGWKSLTSGPVAGKFVDNSQHEFNASLKMNLTPEQLKNTLAYMSKLSIFVKYDIDEYNCTDFSLDVFNYSRPSNPLEVSRAQLPYGSAPNGSRTPQELYKTLDKMQRVSVERGNINFPGIKAWVNTSNGPCD
jgi:hypothetical protein